MKFKILAIVVVGIAILGVLFALHMLSGPNKETCRIGAVLPLTGPASHIGEWQKQGIKIAVGVANERFPKNKRIEVLFEDSRGQPTEAISAFNKLVSLDRVSVVFSSLSAISNPLVPLATDRECPLVMISVSYPGIAEKSPWAFRDHPGSEDEALAMNAFIRNQTDANSIAILYINDDFGLGAYKAFREAFTSSGGTIAYSDSYEKDKTQFRSEIRKAIDTNPEGVYVIGYVNATAILIKQLREAGFQKLLACNMAMSVPEYLEMVGKGFENTYFTITSFGLEADWEQAQTFTAAYKKATGSNPNVFAAMAYDGIGMVVAAIERCGSSRDEIRRGLSEIRDYEGSMGRLEISPEGNVKFPLKIAVFEDGKLRVVPRKNNFK